MFVLIYIKVVYLSAFMPADLCRFIKIFFCKLFCTDIKSFAKMYLRYIVGVNIFQEELQDCFLELYNLNKLCVSS